MPMESLVKFHTPQMISGDSQQNSVAEFSLTTEIDGAFPRPSSMEAFYVCFCRLIGYRCNILYVLHSKLDIGNLKLQQHFLYILKTQLIV